jgi:hypothetical protein
MTNTNLINIVKKYPDLLEAGRNRFGKWPTYQVIEKVKFNLSHSEVLLFIGMKAAKRQACPFHPSGSGTDFTCIMGDQYKGREGEQFPRYWCCNSNCPYKADDMIGLVYNLFQGSRREICYVLLAAKLQGLLIDKPLEATINTPANPNSPQSRLRRLHAKLAPRFEGISTNADREYEYSIVTCKIALYRLFSQNGGLIIL